MITSELASLPDQQAIAATKFVIEKWTQHAPSQRKALDDKFEEKITELAHTSPADIPQLETELETKEAAQASRYILITIRNLDDYWARWVEEGIAASRQGRAQFADPVSLGLILIGLVIAARVKKIDKEGVVFEPGIPGALSRIAELFTGL
jgi:hypothetical protein